MITIPAEHLYADGIDVQVREELSLSLEAVAFISRHRSESNQRSLTCHPIGNYQKAAFGGRDNTLVPAAPSWMTQTLRGLSEGEGLGYSVRFEVTHHGPFLTTPTFYAEAGSDPTAWQDPAAAAVIARSLLSTAPTGGPVAVGIGGGHYAPRHTEIALRRKIQFGHLVPAHALDDSWERSLELAIQGTPGVQAAYVQGQGLSKSREREVRQSLSSRGLEVVHESDLEKSL